MQVTRRFWAAVSLAMVLLAGAWVLDKPFLVVGAATVSASLVAQQLVFVLAVTRLPDDLDVTQSVSREELTVGTDLDVVLRAELPYASPFSLSITVSPPIAATGPSDEECTAVIDVGDDTSTTDVSFQFPVAGEYLFSAPTVSVRDPLGVFETTLVVGSSTTTTVTPGYPRNLHVGVRGERVVSSLGTSKTGYRGVGFDPAEIREFVPGDTMRHIDWKTSARMNSLYVREFEQKTDISNVIVIDHRPSMGVGKRGRTKLDFARQVALGFVTNGKVTNTPCGLYCVGEPGLTVRRMPSATNQHFEQLRTELRKLSPTESVDSGDGTAFGGSSRFPGTVTNARTATTRLVSDSAFDTRLRPFFESRSSPTAISKEKPLYHAVRMQRANLRETVVAVFFTDDTARMELRETIKMATQRYERVIVFVTPSVLFEPMGLTDLPRAYDRYVDFEEFRKTLADGNKVGVYEVGPQDRLEAILSAPQTSRPTQGGGR